MGLDATLSVRTYLYNKPELTNIIKEKLNIWKFEPECIDFEILYWRKAWQIHFFLVDHVQEVTDGSYINIPRVLIQDLYDRIVKILEDHSLALQLLPDDCLDDWYFSQLQYTKEALEKLFKSEFWDNDFYQFYYEASW